MVSEERIQDWYYFSNGERRGPVDGDTLMSLYERGVIPPNTSVWYKGMQNWVPLHQTAIFQNTSRNTPPPVSGDAVDNTMVWILAFMPILGSIAEYIVADAFDAWGNGSLWVVTFLLNVLFSYFDDKKLRAAGYDTKKLGSYWAVPVYLFKRAKMLIQPPSYAIVWVVTFVVMLFM